MDYKSGLVLKCISLFGVIVAYGCVPVLFTNYEPSGQGRLVTMSHCGVDLHNGFAIDLEFDTEIMFSIWSVPDNAGLVLRVSIYVAPGQRVQLTQSTVSVSALDAGQPEFLPIISMSKYARGDHPKSVSVDVGDPMFGDESRTAFPTRYERAVVYGFEINIPSIKHDSYIVAMPPLKIGDKIVNIPEVGFSKRRRAHLAGLCA